MQHFNKVDNPGLGNCAFYSFSIAMIDVIKHEHHRLDYSPTFNQWCEFSPEIKASKDVLLPQILTFNYKRQNKELLDVLQASLRDMLFRTRYAQLNAQNLQNQTVYNQFAEIVRNFFNGELTERNYNDLAHSDSVVKLARNLAKRLKNLHRWVEGDADFGRWEVAFDGVVLETFKKDVYVDQQIAEETSQIVASLRKIKQNFHWGTHSDLNQLSVIFNVNFHYLVNDVAPYPFVDEPGKPVVTINNQRNSHWTTRIKTVKPENDEVTAYMTDATDSVLSKNEICHIFESYAGGFLGIFKSRRHHIAKANEIIAACKDDSKSVDNILTIIQEYIIHKIQLNRDGDFMKRVNYISGRHQFYNGADVKLDHDQVIEVKATI